MISFVFSHELLTSFWTVFKRVDELFDHINPDDERLVWKLDSKLKF